ncbi:DUF1697 domain-containing protein [Maribellus comscasis]|uniref:DUF1697 domain-containing protein n=1 Tax=Maribellus comscasis TaxID=2681766 RepID=A0A6I6K0R2_9BACT|nr:DUF1697 domain-containing protein [Maribellus comscasis]QGY47030.1 DUF1697 domain-containing protein [Maribellus comscasis]
MEKYVAFLRGINVGGHHKVPMADLLKEMAKIGFKNIITLLNSGNIIFEADEKKEKKLEKKIAAHLEKAFGFPIPVLIRKADEIRKIIDNKPFKDIEITKNIRLYITFLAEVIRADIKLPWYSEDNSFQILRIGDKHIESVLDLSQTKTIKAMGILEQLFGKDITTRNLNTLIKISDKISKT